MTITTFADTGLSADLCATLSALGLHQPTPIQQQAIPALLEGADMLGIAQTGTGKTAAFGLPLIAELTESGRRAKPRRPLALALAPTRELAAQIAQALGDFSGPEKLRITTIFGGVGQGRQIQALQKGIDILVATPGRLLDLMSQGELHLDAVQTLILDEADRLLDLGFARDIKRIVAAVPKARQTLLFSATMPKEVTALANSILHNPVRVDVSPKQVTARKIEQHVAFVRKADKPHALATLLKRPEVEKAIVFTRTKHGADKVAKKLNAAGIGAAAIHGNKSQNARTRALDGFLSGDCWALVATDIAARGIDISGVSHVINFELPQDPESYVHRIGRTGRAGADGCAWTLVDEEERKGLKIIQKLIKQTLPEMTIDFADEAAAAAERVRNSQSGQSQADQGAGRGAPQGNGAGSRAAGQSGQGGRRRRSGARGSGQGSDARSAGSAGAGNGNGNGTRRRRR
ncbi:MAG: DEAD/DEAH box helicase, partial [Pseudomonadota bacterium]